MRSNEVLNWSALHQDVDRHCARPVKRATNMDRRVFMFLMRQWHRDMRAYESNGHGTQNTE